MGDWRSNGIERLRRSPDFAVQLADGTGFRYSGRRYQGFGDRPTLPFPVRQQVARWAVALGTASRVQEHLAALDRQESTRTELGERLHAEVELLSSQAFERAMAALSPDQQRRVLRPHVVLGTTFAWPLRPGEAARVIGSVSENQLRDWDQMGLVRPVRWGSGNYRGYFRSQLLAAFLIAGALDAGWTIQRIREEIGVSAPPDRTAVNALHELVAVLPSHSARLPYRAPRRYVVNRVRGGSSMPRSRERYRGGRAARRHRLMAGHLRG